MTLSESSPAHLGDTSCHAYDNNGNTLTKTDSTGTTTYAWDFENRLTSVTLPGSGGTVTFKYDPFGRRIYKSSSASTSVFAYDANNLIEETSSSGAVVARYSQGLNIDEPLAMLRTGATSYYEADGLGSVTSLSNSSGAVASTYTYDSFGNLTASTGTLVNGFRYTAREFDSETSLYFYRARYYDPNTGRFLNEDPITFSSGLNFYSYVSNAPTQLADPYGLFSLEFSETWTRSGEPWWDPTEWGRDYTAVSTKLDVHCVQVGKCGWQPRIKLSVRFAVTHDHDPLAYFHEKEHIEAMKYFFKKSEPYFGFLERKTYKTKEACEATAMHQANQVLDLVWEAMSNPNNRVDWKQRLRFLF